MNGSILIFKPGSISPEVQNLTAAPKLEELKSAIGGGWLEVVPGFVDRT